MLTMRLCPFCTKPAVYAVAVLALRKKREETRTHCVGNARKIKSPGHPALGPGEWPVSEDSPGIEASLKSRQGVLTFLTYLRQAFQQSPEKEHLAPHYQTTFRAN